MIFELRAYLSELEDSVRSLVGFQTVLVESLIFLSFVSFYGLCFKVPMEGYTEYPRFLTLLLGLFMLWLSRIYKEAKHWRRLQREGYVTETRPSILVDAPVLYRLSFSVPILCLTLMMSAAISAPRALPLLILGLLFFLTSFLYYLIQWCALSVKDGFEALDVGGFIVVSVLSLIFPAMMILSIPWIRFCCSRKVEEQGFSQKSRHTSDLSTFRF